MLPKILTLPGLYNSGPQHWQSLWEAHFPDITRVEQADWETPVCADWVARLDHEIALRGDNVVLVAHSLSCALVGKWAEIAQRPIRGALLVAPSDTEADTYPPGTSGFTPMPTKPLPFPSIVVASSNDIYMTQSRTAYFAQAWGSELVWIENAGHINSESNLGIWPQGLALLAKLTGDPRFIL